MLVLRRKDKRDVYMISTKHESVEIVRHINKQFKKTMKAKCILAYNKGMGGINRQDQMLACFPIMKKVIKGYRTLFSYMSDTDLFVTYVIHKTIHRPRK